MATQTNSTIQNRFHNLSPAMLADLIGQLDRKAKDATSELDAAKDAFKARGVLIAEGEAFIGDGAEVHPGHLGQCCREG